MPLIRGINILPFYCDVGIMWFEMRVAITRHKHTSTIQELRNYHLPPWNSLDQGEINLIKAILSKEPENRPDISSIINTLKTFNVGEAPNGSLTSGKMFTIIF